MSTKQPVRDQRSGGPDGRVIAIAVAVVVVVAAIAAILLAGGDDGSDATTATGGDSPEDVALANFGAVRVEGDPLPALTEGDDPAIGLDGPTITSEQASGTVEVDPGADGEPTMLLFLAHWCPHCQAELPEFVALDEEGAFEGIRTVAVLTSSSEDQPNFPPSEWLDEEGWTGERFFDDRDGSAGQAYGLTSFPYTVFLDAEGAVVDRFVGGEDARVLDAAERARG